VRHRADNDDIADVLERVGALLAVQGASSFRVRAYHHGARTVRELGESVAEMAEREGPRALEQLPGIGASLASAIGEFVHTGRLGMLERLEGQVSPEDLFCTVPGIGEDLAHRIHAELGIETLEDLELAAHDGRLEGVAGFGPRRVRGVRDALGGILSRSARRRARRIHELEGRGEKAGSTHRPQVETLLAVDDEYRRRAEHGELRKIVPRRFNPERQAWLPVLHTERDGWTLSALFSNTARAHELGRTRDWVILYYEHDGDEGQCTVVTETHGPLEGRRVVRGRESECARHYTQRETRSPAQVSG
jgi:hypothetical protein